MEPRVHQAGRVRVGAATVGPAGAGRLEHHGRRLGPDVQQDVPGGRVRPAQVPGDHRPAAVPDLQRIENGRHRQGQVSARQEAIYSYFCFD